MNSLEQIKQEWQGEQADVLVEYVDKHLGANIVVCNSGPRGGSDYTVYRYFRIGDQWHCSADLDRVQIHDVLEWMADQLGDLLIVNNERGN